MGSGKSHLANQLASKSHIETMDLDAVIEKEQQCSIGQLFSEKGEDGFRKIESETLRRLVETLSHNGHTSVYVISCGGGTPCFHGNMDWMNEKGLTVWLNPPHAVLFSRLLHEKAHRPLIAALNENQLKDFIATKLAEREPFYSKAKIILHESNPDPVIILNSIQHA